MTQGHTRVYECPAIAQPEDEILDLYRIDSVDIAARSTRVTRTGTNIALPNGTPVQSRLVPPGSTVQRRVGCVYGGWHARRHDAARRDVLDEVVFPYMEAFRRITTICREKCHSFTGPDWRTARGITQASLTFGATTESEPSSSDKNPTGRCDCGGCNLFEWALFCGH